MPIVTTDVLDPCQKVIQELEEMVQGVSSSEGSCPPSPSPDTHTDTWGGHSGHLKSGQWVQDGLWEGRMGLHNRARLYRHCRVWVGAGTGRHRQGRALALSPLTLGTDLGAGPSDCGGVAEAERAQG